jgi:hypothetical protein
MNGLAFDPYQFKRAARPVSIQSQLSWQDFQSMTTTTHSHKQSGERRLPTPVYAVNDEFLRKLLVVFMETRLGIYQPQGTLLERREAARVLAIADQPRHKAKLDELNTRYVAAQKEKASPERLRDFEIQMENLDTFVRTMQHGGMEVIASVIYFYFRCRFDSVGTGEQCKIKPPHVRQILFKMAKLWETRFNPDGTEKPVVRIPRSARRAEAKEPPPCRRQWDLKEAICLRIFGFTFAQIGERLGVTGECVYLAFKRFGVVCPILKPGAEPKKEIAPAHRFDWNRAAELRQMGKSLAAIATELGVAVQSVVYALRKMGISKPNPELKQKLRKQRKHKFDWEKAAELYRSGMPAHAIANQLGVDSLAVWYALKRQGVESRGHGNKIKEDVLQRIVELRKAGKTVGEISEETGVRHCTVHNWLRKLGVKFPKEQRHFGGVRRIVDVARARRSLAYRC